MMKSHRHDSSPRAPSSPLWMPAEINPLNAPDRSEPE